MDAPADLALVTKDAPAPAAAQTLSTDPVLKLLKSFDPYGLTTGQVAHYFCITTEAAHTLLCMLDESGLAYFSDVEGFWRLTTKGRQLFQTEPK